MQVEWYELIGEGSKNLVKLLFFCALKRMAVWEKKIGDVALSVGVAEKSCKREAIVDILDNQNF